MTEKGNAAIGEWRYPDEAGNCRSGMLSGVDGSAKDDLLNFMGNSIWFFGKFILILAKGNQSKTTTSAL